MGIYNQKVMTWHYPITVCYGLEKALHRGEQAFTMKQSYASALGHRAVDHFLKKVVYSVPEHSQQLNSTIKSFLRYVRERSCMTCQYAFFGGRYKRAGRDARLKYEVERKISLIT